MPIDVVLGDFDVYGPDVVWFAEARVPADWTLAPHPPDLVVEIRSPGTWRHDVGRKKAMYERGGPFPISTSPSSSARRSGSSRRCCRASALT